MVNPRATDHRINRRHSMQQQEAIIISNLSIGYKGKVVERGLSAEVRCGELTCLLGTNGTGKSTMLRTLAGLQPALSGEVCLRAEGDQMQQVEAFSKQELARWVSVVLTEQPDVKQLSVAEMVGMGRMPYTGFFGSLSDDDRRIVAESLEATGMGAFAERYFDALSDGERQKVMIAKALAQQTPIILLDEPTAFLDYPSKVEMMKMLRRLANEMNKTILLSTHDLELALQHADRLLLLGQGLHEMSREALGQYIKSLR